MAAWNNFPEVGIGTWDLEDIAAWQATAAAPANLSTGIAFGQSGLFVCEVQAAVDNLLQPHGWNVIFQDNGAARTIAVLPGNARIVLILQVNGPHGAVNPSRLWLQVGSGAVGANMAGHVKAKLLQRQG